MSAWGQNDKPPFSAYVTSASSTKEGGIQHLPSTSSISMHNVAVIEH
jgi:hypothetical protein